MLNPARVLEGQGEEESRSAVIQRQRLLIDSNRLWERVENSNSMNLRETDFTRQRCTNGIAARMEGKKRTPTLPPQPMYLRFVKQAGSA